LHSIYLPTLREAGFIISKINFKLRARYFIVVVNDFVARKTTIVIVIPHYFLLGMKFLQNLMHSTINF